MEQKGPAKRGNRPISKDLMLLLERVPGLPQQRILEAVEAAGAYPLRVTSFYLQEVLNGSPDDVLLDVVLPSAEEGETAAETWDANQASVRIVDSALWSQKYAQEGLIRLNTHCSANCRYCYIREQTERRLPLDTKELERIFDQLAEERARELREVILSGGDPLTSKPALLSLVGKRLGYCNERRRERGMHPIQLTVHTREPVWRPDYFLQQWPEYEKAFADLDAYAYVFQVIHPREVTRQFQQLVAKISRAGNRSALLLNQHPLFRGINADTAILVELYQRLAEGLAPVKPYYVVHPFDSGTLARHRLPLPESQRLMQELFKSVPGILMPTLVVPTALGKAYVSPFEPLIPGSAPGRWRLRTKTGQEVDYVDLALATQEAPAQMRLPR